MEEKCPQQNAKSYLSHVSVLRGIHCEKYLYLNKFYSQEKKEYSQLHVLISKRGQLLKNEAKKLFCNGVYPQAENDNIDELAEKTLELIEKGEKLIFGGVLIYENIYSRYDIIKNENGKLSFYTIFGRSSLNYNILNGLAIQDYIARQNGLTVIDFTALYLNGNAGYSEKLTLDNLFKRESITRYARHKKRYIVSKIRKATDVINRSEIPDNVLGDYCLKPNYCPFFTYCFNDLPEDHVFTLGHVHLQVKLNLFNEGVTDIRDIPDDTEMNDYARMQLNTARSKETILKKNEIGEFLETFEYPLYFTDFESFQPIIPLFEGTKPLQHIPFQFVLYTKKDEKSEVNYSEFLAEPGDDPREKFLKSFLESTGEKGSIIVYNKASEIRTLTLLCKEFPEYKEAIDNRINRIVDLIEPFEKRYYYAHSMQGSFTLKSVVGTLLDSLSYKSLDIGEGGSAAFIYETLYYDITSEEKKKIIQDLSDYCKTDTIAMVKIWAKLKELVK